MTTPSINPDRLAALDTLTLDEGSHTSFDQGHCAMEVVSWLADQGFTDAPACASPVLARYTIALNDRWDNERRQTLKPYLPRMVGTGDDDKDTRREQIAAEFLSTRLLGPWLELAGMGDHLASVEGKSGQPLRDALWEIRKTVWARRNASVKELRVKVRAELEKRGYPAVAAAAADAAAAAAADAAAAAAADAAAAAAADAAADAAAAAAAAADAAAAAAADAAADAAAAADADAVADAVADAAAAAVADAVAAADADADAVAVAAAAAAAVPGDRYGAAYRAARAYYRENPLPVMAAVHDLAAKQQPLALELLDAMIDPADA